MSPETSPEHDPVHDEQPGFGFSTPLPNNPDLNFWKVADLWHVLMTRTLGYPRYAAAGCDGIEQDTGFCRASIAAR